VIRAAVLALAAAAAAGCGSDLGPASTPPAAPVRIQIVGHSPALADGVHDAIEMIGARKVKTAAEADLVVTGSLAAASAAVAANGGTHVLAVGIQPTGSVPANVRVVEFDRGALAYLAGALAALVAPDVAVAEPGHALEAAFRDGADAGGRAAATSVACGAASTATVVYVPDPSCRPRDPGAQVIAPDRLRHTTMLAVLGTRPAVVVAAAARAVQDGTFQPGVAMEGLREDAIGFEWISPTVAAAAVDRLQHVEDRVRAEMVPIPAVAP
jgi:hypothetical protein